MTTKHCLSIGVHPVRLEGRDGEFFFCQAFLGEWGVVCNEKGLTG